MDTSEIEVVLVKPGDLDYWRVNKDEIIERLKADQVAAPMSRSRAKRIALQRGNSLTPEHPWPPPGRIEHE